ncbi:MAG TPA: mechanosensitive ion channel family protein [Acidimicrobiales bacterium]|nr:mechanosensitive ion channel family protein [Acidimicrobiales bacterium]
MEEEVVAEGLSVADWVSAGTVFLVGIVLGRVLRALLTRRMARDDAEPPAASLVGRFAGYALVLAGLVYALAVLEIRLGPLLGAIGIGGIALALAAQSILSNFLASILLQVRRPFKRGDQICTNDCEGEVEEVNFRTVVLRTYDGERVLVPCADVLDAPIVNYTIRGRRRTTLEVGVSYDSDLGRARDVLEKAARMVDGVLAKPPPEALVEEFDDSSINFAVRFWHAPDIATMWRVRSEVAMAVKQALDDSGLVIPFPQRVVYLPPSGNGSGPDSSAKDSTAKDRTAKDRPVEQD